MKLIPQPAGQVVSGEILLDGKDLCQLSEVEMRRLRGNQISMMDRADMRLLFLCVILGMTGWIGLCRLLRGETLKLRELEYVQAATALGVSNRAILFRHILPNVMHIVLIAVVLDFSGLVLAEAVLSYIGIGVDPAMIPM